MTALFVGLWLLSAAPLSAQTSQGGVIEGVVVDADSGRPVSGATVAISGSETTAAVNALGRFRLDAVTAGPVTLVVTAPGYLPVRLQKVQVRPDTPAVIVELERSPNFMDRVQVTASKSPLAIGDVAAQADVVTRKTFESRGDQRLTQAVAQIPGALVSTQLGVFESVTLRGMPRDGLEFTNTLLLVDGVPQTNSGNAARVVALPINDTSSIEVVRGPNSALYGRTAIGGAINVRTADPTPDHELGVDLAGGQFEALKGVAHASGPVGRRGGYYVSAGRERDGGYFTSQTNPDFTVGNTAFFGKLTFVPDQQSFGSISLNRVDSDNSTPTNEPVVDGRFLHDLEPGFDRFTSFNLPGTNYSQGETRFTLNYARELTSSTRLVEVFGYRSVRQEFIEDGDFIGAPIDVENNLVAQYPFSQDLNEDILYQELRVEYSPRASRLRQSLTAGGSYEHNGGTLASDFIYTDEDLFGWYIDYLNPVIPPRSEWQHDTSSREYTLGISALFAQYIVEPHDRVVMTAGGRYDRLALENTRSNGDHAEDTFSAFSPKVTATFRLLRSPSAGGEPSGATVNIYGAYSQAFLPPRRPSSLIPDDVALNLQPEDIDNYEGGVKGTVLDGRASFEATAFWMKESGVVLSTRQGAFFLPTNAGEQRYKGVETGGRLLVHPEVSLYANASFYRNRFGEFVIASEDGDEVLNGHRLPIAPDRVINWGAAFTPAEPLSVVFNVKHVGTVQANRENTFALPSYSLVDAAVTWRRGPLRLTLSAHNLFNQEYYWNGDGETADPGRPRQVLLSTSIVMK